MCTDNLQLTVAKQGKIDNLQQQLLCFAPSLLDIVTVENNWPLEKSMEMVSIMLYFIHSVYIEELHSGAQISSMN